MCVQLPYKVFLHRLHCLHQWVICGLLLVEDGTDKWRRYYVKRKRLDNHMEEGHPTRDYTVSRS